MATMKKTVLLVDDESDILEFVGYNLSKEGYNVLTALNGKQAIDVAMETHPDLILLDVMMPVMDGIETCRVLRSKPQFDSTTIAMLSARADDYSQIDGFEAGADDYITKPIKIKVLMSRVKALLKRHIPDDGLAYGKIVVDRERHLVVIDGKKHELPRKEFNLIELLASKPHKVFTREQIYQSIWGDDVIVGDRTIDVHIRKLREKIGEDFIVTIKGVGYKFEVPESLLDQGVEVSQVQAN